MKNAVNIIIILFILLIGIVLIMAAAIMGIIYIDDTATGNTGLMEATFYLLFIIIPTGVIFLDVMTKKLFRGKI